MKKKRILITGASGFLGQHVTEMCAAYECFLLLKSANQTIPCSNHRCFFSVDELIHAVPEMDVVIHLAAHIPYGSMNEPSMAMNESNVHLTRTLAQYYPRARWVFASSVSVYGTTFNGIVTSQTPANPETCYAQTKYNAEQIVARLTNAAIIRFSSIIGPAMKPVSMIPMWIKEARTKRRITVWGRGSREQNYIDVRDAARLVYILIMNDWQGVILGISPRMYSNFEVATLLSKILNAEIIHTSHTDETGPQYNDKQTHEIIEFTPTFELTYSLKNIIQS